jgi:hypothetical protein
MEWEFVDKSATNIMNIVFVPALRDVCNTFVYQFPFYAYKTYTLYTDVVINPFPSFFLGNVRICHATSVSLSTHQWGW